VVAVVVTKQHLFALEEVALQSASLATVVGAVTVVAPFAVVVGHVLLAIKFCAGGVTGLLPHVVEPATRLV